MESKDTTRKVKEKEQSKTINSINMFNNLNSDYFVRKLFEYISKRKSLKTIKYNKNIQKRIGININDYKDYSEKYSSIELEIIPMKGGYRRFIYIKEEDKNYYHIYFNDIKENEIKITSLNGYDNIYKINIIIDYQVKSFEDLFMDCNCIKSINFKKFYRNNVTNMGNMFRRCLFLEELNLNNFNTNNVIDMSCMFKGCKRLKALNLNNFNTNNVTNMRYMFSKCSSLKELNLNNFNTNKVTNMSGMFNRCFSLKELNLNNFNTNNVTNMRYMFNECFSLKELNLNNFNTNNVIDMSRMFRECSSLKELNLNNFNTNNVTNMIFMFKGCSDELKLKIKSKFKNFKKEAFYNKEY